MTAPLTPARLSEIRARAEAATDGPWVAEEQLGNLVIRHPYGDSAMGWDFVGDSGVYQCDDPYDDCRVYAATADIDAAFIAAARQDVPDLLAEVDRLTAALDVAEKAIEGAPHVGTCNAWKLRPSDPCTCWKSEFDAAKGASETTAAKVERDVSRDPLNKAMAHEQIKAQAEAAKYLTKMAVDRTIAAEQKVKELESALASERARNADLEAGYSSSTRRELASEARALAAEKQLGEWAFQCGEANAGEDIAEARALAAEAVIKQAPHDSLCNSHRRGAYGMDDWICDCWKAEYDAAKEAQK